MAFPAIQDFKSRLIDGGARPSLFQMQIQFPTTFLSGVDAGLKAPFHCRLAEIPGESVNPIVIKYAGREVKFAAARTYTNLTVTIINDEGFTVRRGIENWMNYMNERNNNTTTGLSPEGGYGGTGIVTQYSKTGAAIRNYSFIDMFPVTLAPIPLDWSNDAAIEEYTVDFAYLLWEPGIVTSGGGGAARTLSQIASGIAGVSQVAQAAAGLTGGR